MNYVRLNGADGRSRRYFDEQEQKKNEGVSPKAGDESTPLLYAALIVISAGMIIHIICKYVKNSKNQKE